MQRVSPVNAGRNSLVPNIRATPAQTPSRQNSSSQQTLNRSCADGKVTLVVSRVPRVVKLCSQRKFRVMPAANKKIQGTAPAAQPLIWALGRLQSASRVILIYFEDL